MGEIAFGRYQIRRELGRGAMGIVYEAHDPGRGIDVALKVMAVAKATKPEARKRHVERFTREAQALAELAHPCVARLYDRGEIGHRHFFAMELIRGTTLKDRIHMQGPLSVGDLLRLGLQLCDVLEHIHQRGVVHRDVKPENIMLLADGGVKLMDFGIAQTTVNGGPAPSGGFQGSPAYMSPEQATGKPVDRRSDLYSLAVTLYETATGRRAVPGDTIPVIAQQVQHEFPPPPAGLPPFLQGILFKGLAKDPAFRYQTAAEMADDLRLQRSPVFRRPHPSGPVSPGGPMPAPVPAPRPAPHALPMGGYFAPPPDAAPPFAAPVPPPPVAAGPPPPPPPPLEEFAGDFQVIRPEAAVPHCRAHPRVPAVALCAECGAQVCDTCLVEVQGRGVICRVCAFAG